MGFGFASMMLTQNVHLDGFSIHRRKEGTQQKFAELQAFGGQTQCNQSAF
jgi:hypothetical protein